VPGREDGSSEREAFIPSAWRPFYEASRIPAAVRAGQTLYVTGHSGETAEGVFPDDVEAQVRGTFRNIALTLAEAGVDWAHVVELTSYTSGCVARSPCCSRSQRSS